MVSHQKIVIGGAHIVKNEFDRPSLVHKVKKLDTIMFFVNQDKILTN